MDERHKESERLIFVNRSNFFSVRLDGHQSARSFDDHKSRKVRLRFTILPWSISDLYSEVVKRSNHFEANPQNTYEPHEPVLQFAAHKAHQSSSIDLLLGHPEKFTTRIHEI